MSTTNAPVLCSRCGARHPWRPACPDCGALLRVPADLDAFALLGLPRGPAVDRERLTARYYELSRAFHPDAHAGGGEDERAASLANTAALNRAYRTLRSPVALAGYWLELHGEHLGRDNNRVPPAVAARVFEVQEELDELRAAPRDEARSGRVAAIADGLRADLAAADGRVATALGAATDAAGLAALKAALSERAYLKTLLGDVEKLTEGSWNESSASI